MEKGQGKKESGVIGGRWPGGCVAAAAVLLPCCRIVKHDIYLHYIAVRRWFQISVKVGVAQALRIDGIAASTDFFQRWLQS